MMGCSNPHPHGQIWALSHIPTIAATELASLARYAVNPDVGFSKAHAVRLAGPACYVTTFTSSWGSPKMIKVAS